MDERKYKTIEGTGIMSLVVGIIVICGGVAAGVLMVVSGAKLLYARRDMLI